MLQFINWKLQRNHTNVFNACIEGKSLHSLISTPANEKCARAQQWGPSKALLHAQERNYRTKV